MDIATNDPEIKSKTDSGKVTYCPNFGNFSRTKLRRSKESKGQNVAGLTAFMTQMVFAAGVYGVIGFESAERILRILSRIYFHISRFI